MPSRPDLREIASNVRDAFAEMDKDTLLDILTFVIKEYVVEGPPPMLVHQAETLADLRVTSFAQLVNALQTRFEFPELAMLVVDNDQVSVRVNGVVQPMLAPRTVGVPAGGAPAPAPQFVDTRPQPGVRVVESNLSPRPAPAPAPSPLEAPVRAGAEPRTAPPPSRGLSIRGGAAPTPGGGDRPPAAAAAAPPAGAAPAAPAPAAREGGVPEKPEGSGDDASARFSLLELD